MYSPAHRVFMASPSNKGSGAGAPLRLRRLSSIVLQSSIANNRPHVSLTPTNTFVEVTPLDFVPGGQCKRT